jgi:hypothetical protein
MARITSFRDGSDAHGGQPLPKSLAGTMLLDCGAGVQNQPHCLFDTLSISLCWLNCCDSICEQFEHVLMSGQVEFAANDLCILMKAQNPRCKQTCHASLAIAVDDLSGYFGPKNPWIENDKESNF